MSTDKAFLARTLYTMQLIRRFELAVAAEVEAGVVSGMAHLSAGQEATSVGAIAALEKRDYVSSTHRAHGHALAKGSDPKRMMAEIFGKEMGLDHGRGGNRRCGARAHRRQRHRRSLELAGRRCRPDLQSPARRASDRGFHGRWLHQQRLLP